MSRLFISKTADCFEKDGKRFFYFADTAWAAIPRATADEWTQYLDYRKLQGFNAIQFNLLPVVHDMSDSESDVYPFRMIDSRTMDFHSIKGLFQSLHHSGVIM